MNAKVISSEDMRNDWPNVVGNVVSGGTVVVEQANRPVAAVIPYEDFIALQEQLEDLYDIRMAEAALEEYERDPSTAIPWEEAKAALRAEGLLDEE